MGISLNTFTFDLLENFFFDFLDSIKQAPAWINNLMKLTRSFTSRWASMCVGYCTRAVILIAHTVLLVTITAVAHPLNRWSTHRYIDNDICAIMPYIINPLNGIIKWCLVSIQSMTWIFLTTNQKFYFYGFFGISSFISRTRCEVTWRHGRSLFDQWVKG